MTLLNLGINIGFRAICGLSLLEISYLDRFFFHLYLPVTTTHNLWKRNSLCTIRRRSSTGKQSNVVNARWSRITRELLNNNYTNRWIGRRGPIAWPACSPDLNPLDFYSWRYLKTIVYDIPVVTAEYSEIVLSLRVGRKKKQRNTPGIF